MAWLKLSGSTLPFAARFPIAVDASALGASTDKDVTVTIPKTLELFWSLILSSGNDIRITDSDGITLVDYDWASFTYASRTGTLEIYGQGGTNTWEAEASSINLLWIYVGDADAADASITASTTSPLSGYLTAEQQAEVVVVGDPTPDRTTPDNRRSKSSSSRRAYWFDFSPVLRRMQRRYNDRLEFEELDFVEVSSVSGGSGASIEVEAATRFAGTAFVRVVVSGGTDATDYTLIVKATTKLPDDSTTTTRQVVEGRLLIQVRDQDDA
jgi:hypothetical protein